MTSLTEDEIEFESLFASSRYAATTRTHKRLKAERRAALTDKQHARGGRARSVQINFRATPSLKALIANLADQLELSAADVIEEAIHALSTKHGLKLDA